MTEDNPELLAYEAWMKKKSVDVSRLPVEKRWGDRIHVHDAVHIGWEAWKERSQPGAVHENLCREVIFSDTPDEVKETIRRMRLPAQYNGIARRVEHAPNPHAADMMERIHARMLAAEAAMGVALFIIKEKS